METRTIYNKKKRRKKRLRVIFILLCLVILIFSLFKIFVWHKDNDDTKKITDDLSDSVYERKADKDKSEDVNPPSSKSDDYWDYIKMDMLSANFDVLKKKNSDTIGFIKVNGTNINYPVVQSDDNKYYLNHAFDKSKNSAGWVFADYRNNMKNFDQNTIIYAHSRLNSTMFGSLKNILDSKWYDDKDNYIVKFSTPYENTLWRVFSVYSIKTESYYLTTSFSSTSSYETFLQELKNRSKKDFEVSLSASDKIITLSTCKDVAGTERVVMHAKLIKREER